MTFNQGDRVTIIATRDDCKEVHIHFFPNCFYLFDNVVYNPHTDVVTFTGFYGEPNEVRNFTGGDPLDDNDGRKYRAWFLPPHCFYPYAGTTQQKAFLKFRQAMLAKSRHAAY
jgi:hypothetical protein